MNCETSGSRGSIYVVLAKQEVTFKLGGEPPDLVDEFWRDTVDGATATPYHLAEEEAKD